MKTEQACSTLYRVSIKEQVLEVEELLSFSRFLKVSQEKCKDSQCATRYIEVPCINF